MAQRTGTFSDERVIEETNRRFVGVWKNIRPEPGFGDGLYPATYGRDLAAQLANGTAPNNVASLFCTSDGILLHVVEGYWRATDYLKEVEFAVTLSSSDAKDRADSHSRRAATFAKSDPCGEIHELLARNPGRRVEDLLKNSNAGIR
jgi:hypothetical protein